MSIGSERQSVQNPFIRYAEEAGWTYLSPEEALRLRGGEESPVLRTVLIEQLQRLNPGVVDSSAKAQEIIDRLIRIPPTIEGNLKAWEYLRGLKTVFVEAERRERNLKILDLAHLEANAFHITDEFSFTNGRFRIRADIALLINGIPVLVVEAKAATRAEGIDEAFDQIRRYHEQAPELMVQTQLFVLTQLVKFFYGPTWNLSRKALFNWKDEQAGDFETLVKRFVAPSRLLRLLSDGILFVRRDGELSKAVLRLHQLRATDKALGRFFDPKRRRGLVWHTQGSGKTYTMITVAKCLLEDARFQNPTVLMIVDRNELQQQLFQNLEAVGFGHVHIARSKRHLRKLLRNDTRGLIVSMIHKFEQADADLNERANIFVLIDEAHRSTGGDLGNYLMGALPNATFIGFTGTPIDKSVHGKGTFALFGGDDPGGYLDKYSIRESIEDGTTVPLHYQLAPNELIVDRAAMEKEFWQAAELEGVADVEEINRVLDRAVTLKNMLKNEDRIGRIAAFVAEHFRQFVAPMGYKAFLVAVDREACARYKEALDRHLPPEQSAVVISASHNDPPELRRHHLGEEEEMRLRKAFRRPDADPQILIVTEKLLTGYDAPILYCMYLDKPMRDHVLLQAIARVNRPYEDDHGRRKTSGLIIDFVGIFDNLHRALCFDSKDIKGVVEDLDVLKAHFEALMAQARERFLPIIKGKQPDKAVEAILEHFRSKDARNEFYRYVQALQETYEVLSPDAFLRPFLPDYRDIVEIYRVLRSSYDPHASLNREFLRKTVRIVQQHTHLEAFAEPMPSYEIGLAALKAIARQNKPDVVKVFDLLRGLRRFVEQHKKEKPHLIPIGERAEAVRKAFEDRQIDSQQAAQQMEEVLHQAKQAEAERRQSKLSAEAFAVAWWLQVQKGIEPQKARLLAAEVEKLLRICPHWSQSAEQERELRRRLYKLLIEAGIDRVVAYADEMLTLLRRGQA